MASIIQLRNDLRSVWNSVDPILANGELGYETDFHGIKIGNGTSTWSNLDYVRIVNDVSVTFVEQTDLNINGANGNYVISTLTANAAFSGLINLSLGIQYFFLIKNNSGATITITLPNTADIKSVSTVAIDGGKYREFSMIYNGTKRIWQISEMVA